MTHPVRLPSGRYPRLSPDIRLAPIQKYFFWDGRAASLETQVMGPLTNPEEMGWQSAKSAEQHLQTLPDYTPEFKAAFGLPVSLNLTARAIAAYERSLPIPESRVDQFLRGDRESLTQAERAGWRLFNGSAQCASCHPAPDFTDRKFHALGLAGADPGRMGVTGRDEERGQFRTPSLRALRETGPYFHDGSAENLEKVIEVYDVGGGPANPKDSQMAKLHLTEEEKRDLVALLRAMKSDSY